MPRGRPRKIEVIEEPHSIEWVIARIAHDWCSMGGCQVKHHLQEASDIIDALKIEGFIITELK